MPRLARLRLLLLVVTLSGCAVGVPTSQAPSEPASASPRPSPSASASAAPPSVQETPSASPEASTIADPALLDLEVIGCPGGVVLDWSPSTHPSFHHYTALRSSDADIATEYPPIAPAVDWGDTYATDPFVTSAVDDTVLPSAQLWNYRVMAYAADGTAVSASPVRAARLSEELKLGKLTVSGGPDNTTRFAWKPFAGFSGCFSAYRILAGTSGGAPSSELTIISDQATDTYQTDALHAGITYRLQVQAVRVTTLGSFVAGATSVATYEVP